MKVFLLIFLIFNFELFVNQSNFIQNSLRKLQNAKNISKSQLTSIFNLLSKYHNLKDGKSFNCDIKGWNYEQKGVNWPCEVCQKGKLQSPINLSKEKSTKISKENIFIDFEGSLLKNYPIVYNSGNAIEIQYDCGRLLTPRHFNLYSCYKVEIHSPSEHSIGGVHQDLEIQIFYKIKHKNIIDGETKENIIISVLYKGVEDCQNFSTFLSKINIGEWPKGSGQATQIKSHLNMRNIINEKLLCDLKPANIKKIEGLENFQDLLTEKNYPLKKYFKYNGSLSKPPCYENTTYLVNADVKEVPYSQIIKITKLIDSNSKGGNNRAIQTIKDHNVYFYDIKSSD